MRRRTLSDLCGANGGVAASGLPGALGPVAAVLLAFAVVAGCGGPILANPPVLRPSPPATPALPTAPADPQPIVFPRDDGPHRRLTEWWYQTGHLRDRASGARFGFEYVVFRAERGDFPVTWASHLAITDESGGRFVYAQRSEVGPQVDRSSYPGGEPAGFAFDLRGLDPTRPETLTNPPWTMSGAGGSERLSASLSAAEAAAAGVSGGLAIDLQLSTTRPPVLHDRDGWIDFGPAGGSYYYSRTRLATTGSLLLDGRTFEVEGSAWFDHQWGDFIAVGAGGWDWFAINLDGGTDVTLSRVRDATGADVLVYGTLVGVDGQVRHLTPDTFAVESTGQWTSPKTGIRYPAGWLIRLPAERLEVRLVPTVADQELDTRPTSGVVYWEGSQRVTATWDGQPLGGEAYVELTGYGPVALGR